MSAIYWFNPAVEAHIGFWPEVYQPPRGVLQLTADLQHVPMFFAGAEDVVLVTARPPEAHLQALADAGFSIPRFHLVERPVNARRLLGGLTQLQLKQPPRLAPWGWGPDACAALAPLLREAGEPPWAAERRHFGSKARSSQWAHALAAEDGDTRAGWADIRGRDFVDAGSTEEALADLLTRWPRAVIKGALGASGRDMVRVDPEELRTQATVRGRWLARLLHRHGAVVVEPWLDRVLDVGYQIEVGRDGVVRTIGASRFLTDIRGQYQGGILGDLSLGLTGELREWLQQANLEGALSAYLSRVGRILADAGYVGPAGVDNLVFRDARGFHLRPLVELNARYTMGRLSLALGERLAPGASGVWLHMNARAIQDHGFTGLPGFLAWLERAHPWQLADGGLVEGALPTTPVGAETHTATVMLVGEAATAVCRRLKIELGGRGVTG